MAIELNEPEPALMKSAFGRFPSGVAALAATINGEKVGLVASSFSVGVSFEPPMVMFSVQNSSTTWPLLRTADAIGVSILADAHNAICYQLASRSRDRFAGVDVHTSESGAVFIPDSALWMECRIVSEIAAGDHTVIVLEVARVSFESHIEPLVYHGAAFKQLVTAGNAAA